MLLLLGSLLAALPAPATTTACAIIPPAVHDQAWRAACEAAIAVASEPGLKAELMFRSGYVYNEHEAYQDAERALQGAVRLDPAHAEAWQELSYTENALGNYAPAEAAADRVIALVPASVQPYQERAMARHYQANLAGAWADRDRVARMAAEDPDARLGRASEAIWLGRFDEVAADLDAAAASAPSDAQRRRIDSLRTSLRLWRTRSGAADPAAACVWPNDNDALLRPGLIGDCSAAFLAEARPAKRADFLTVRSLAWIIAAHDRDAATDDLAVAAALEPANADRHTNLGFRYLDAHHSWAASREFDRALASGENWTALAGRAAAKYNLHNPRGAFGDARRSFELHPNEGALTVLGDLAHDRGDNASARLYWMGAYHLGDRDDGLTERLHSIGVDHPENESAPH